MQISIAGAKRLFVLFPLPCVNIFQTVYILVMDSCFLFQYLSSDNYKKRMTLTQSDTIANAVKTEQEKSITVALVVLEQHTAIQGSRELTVLMELWLLS